MLLYDADKAAGICVRCRTSNALEGHVMCAPCMKSRSEYNKSYKQTATGRERVRAGKVKAYYKRRALEVCTRCSLPSAGKAFCPSCYAENGRHNYQKRKRARELVLAALGNKCSHCGIDDVRVLQVDHVIPCGRSGRKRIQGSSYYERFLSREVLPSLVEGKRLFQLLCANCNWIKRHENGEMKASRYTQMETT